MDEWKDKDVDRSTVVESCKEIVCDQVVSEDSVKTRVVEPAASEVQVRGSGEGVGAEGGSCDVEEIKPGVMGSDACVDAVCPNDCGGGCAGNSSSKATGDQEPHLEKDLKNLGGGEGKDDDSGSKPLMCSGMEVSVSGTEPEVGKSLGFAEFHEESKLDEGETVVRDDTADASTSQGESEVGIDVRTAGAAAGSTSRESQVMAEKVPVSTGDGSMDVGLKKDEEIRPSKNEILDQRVDNGVGDASAHEANAVIVVKSSESAEEVMDHNNRANGSGGEAQQDSETQKIGVLQNEVWKPGIETTSTSSDVGVDSGADVQGFKETMEVTDLKISNPNVEVGFEETRDSGIEKAVLSSPKRDSVSTEKDATLNATSDCLDGQTRVAVDGKIASTDSEATGSPDIEDMQASKQLTRIVVAGEVVAAENKMLSNSKNDETLVTADFSGYSHISAQVHSNAVPERAERATDSNEAGAHIQQGKLETTNDNTANHRSMSRDSTTSCEPAHAGDEVAETDDQIHIDPNSFSPVNIQWDGTLSSSRDNQHSKAEVAFDNNDAQVASMHKDKVSTSSAKVSEPALRKQELKQEECLDKSAVCDLEHDSNTLCLTDGLEQMTRVEEPGKEEKKVIEQQSEAVTAGVSAETDSRVANGGQTSGANNDMTLDSNPELVAHAKEDQHPRFEEGLEENTCRDVFDIESDMGKETAVQECVSGAHQIGLHEPKETEAEEQNTDSEQSKVTEDKPSKQAALNPGNTVKAYQASYQLPPDDEVEFNVSDLVWGKVRSHPWWPGEIFDSSDASEKALKHQKKDCFLVAYFGDRSFAWNEASLLKPFRSNFSQAEKQSNSETFQNAVDCALEEVSRRVEFEMACSCIPRDTYDKIKFQIVENAGILQESSVRESVDKSLRADLFEPGNLVEYIKALARFPTAGADRLELVIAKSQLLSFYRLKGYSELPEFEFCGELSEKAEALDFEDELIKDESRLHKDDGQSSSGQENLQTQRRSYRKRKHNLKDTIFPRKKERRSSDLKDESWDSVDDEIDPNGKPENKLVSPPSEKKLRAFGPSPDDSAKLERRKTVSLSKLSAPGTLNKPSFKIGECIRRVASQMTGSPSILKSNSQKPDGGKDKETGDGSDTFDLPPEDAELSKMDVPTEYSSLDDLLSQLHLAARYPLTGHSFLTVIVSFFSDFRNTVIMEKHDKVGGKRRQASPAIGVSPETFEFEDMSDTYWTDRVIQNGSEEQPARKSRKRDTQIVPADPDKPLNRSNCRKRFSDGSSSVPSDKPVGYVDENAPAELVMHFPVVDSVPSEASLNKMFRRFGPLKEYETETDRDTNRARVVFKKCSDAEAAYGSAPKFNIFGSVLVNYQLNYTVSVPFKAQPVVAFPGEEDDGLFLQF